ncbi:MAG: phosphoribosyltransferase [Lachnospiraceae bacterium]|nr:phosphoribosyltransferase [Lachnospiraceae bacterium]
MKRYIRNKSIYCGVQWDNKGYPVFNYNSDEADSDIIFLHETTSGSYNDDGVRYIYGYRYNPQSRNDERKNFRNYIKNAPQNLRHLDDVMEFIDNGVNSIENYARFADFGVLTYVKPSNKDALVNKIKYNLLDKIDCGCINLELIKRLCKDVKLNLEKIEMILRKAKNRNSRKLYSEDEIEDILHNIEQTYDKMVSNGSVFTMKRFVPRCIRDSFEDFLIFKTEDDRDLYESLQGVDVLLIDDFMTSGTTVKDAIRCLRSVHDKNRLTVFVLVKQ